MCSTVGIKLSYITESTFGIALVKTYNLQPKIQKHLLKTLNIIMLEIISFVKYISSTPVVKVAY